MKKLFLLLFILTLNMAFYSCSNDELADTEGLYQLQANDEEGSNGGDPDDPDGN